jgi:hypothetical protein
LAFIFFIIITSSSMRGKMNRVRAVHFVRSMLWLCVFVSSILQRNRLLDCLLVWPNSVSRDVLDTIWRPVQLPNCHRPTLPHMPVTGKMRRRLMRTPRVSPRPQANLLRFIREST